MIGRNPPQAWLEDAEDGRESLPMGTLIDRVDHRDRKHFVVLSAGPGIPELAVMADVLNLETESTPLNTQLENPELESVTELL